MVVVFTHIGLHGDEVEATCIDGNANWNVCLASQFYLLLTVVCPFYTLEEPDLAGVSFTVTCASRVCPE